MGKQSTRELRGSWSAFRRQLRMSAVKSSSVRSIWGVHEAPIDSLYQISGLLGDVKGWVIHRKQDDRLLTS